MNARLLPLTVALALMLTACGAGGAASQPAPSAAAPASSVAVSAEVTDPYGTRTYEFADLDGSRLRVFGRSAVAASGGDTGCRKGIVLDNVGGGFEITADCEGDVAVEMALVVGTDEESASQYFSVFVDGVLQERAAVRGIRGCESVKTLTLATGLARGIHTFRLFRQTESHWGSTTLLTLTVNGTLSVCTDGTAPRRIEFLGDSITVGYGSLTGRDTEKANTPLYSDGTSAFAFRTAMALADTFTDFSVLGRSGMTFYDDRALAFLEPVSENRPDVGAWKEDGNTALFVIALGTNDTSRCSDDAVLKEKAVALLRAVRKRCPNAKIVWTYGQMKSARASVLRAAVEEAGGEAAGYYFFLFPRAYQDGGGFHPGAAGHAALADALSEYLRSIL